MDRSRGAKSDYISEERPLQFGSYTLEVRGQSFRKLSKS